MKKAAKKSPVSVKRVRAGGRAKLSPRDGIVEVSSSCWIWRLTVRAVLMMRCYFLKLDMNTQEDRVLERRRDAREQAVEEGASEFTLPVVEEGKEGPC